MRYGRRARGDDWQRAFVGRYGDFVIRSNPDGPRINHGGDTWPLVGATATLDVPTADEAAARRPPVDPDTLYLMIMFADGGLMFDEFAGEDGDVARELVDAVNACAVHPGQRRRTRKRPRTPTWTARGLSTWPTRSATADIGETAIEVLRRLGIEIAPGLDDDELERIETTFGIQFGEDHEAMLRAGLPVGGSWVDWRHGSDAELTARLQAPIDGIMSSVDDWDTWTNRWGPRPVEAEAAHEVALADVRTWTTLVPIYSHRYTAAAPSPTGAPVISVHDWDVVHFGADLLDYLAAEFGPRDREWPEDLAPVWPWTQLPEIDLPEIDLPE